MAIISGNKASKNFDFSDFYSKSPIFSKPLNPLSESIILTRYSEITNIVDDCWYV